MGIKGRIMKCTFNFKFLKSISYTLFYELKEISILMEEKEYEKDRKGEFPFLLFRAFELKVVNYLGLR